MSAEYIAGSCNIGKGEVRRRKFVALIGAAITLTTATTLFITDQSRVARLSIFIPAIIFAIGFVQSRNEGNSPTFKNFKYCSVISSGLPDASIFPLCIQIV